MKISTQDPLYGNAILKTYPDVYGHIIEKEKEEQMSVKGILVKVKFYTTTAKRSGIRISLLNNTNDFFVKFNEFLESIADSRPADEKALNLFSFTTLTTAEPGLKEIGRTGFYVYQNHVIFSEEDDNEKSPMERLAFFIEYFKKKFDLRIRYKDELFEELDKLEIGLEGSNNS